MPASSGKRTRDGNGGATTTAITPMLRRSMVAFAIVALFLMPLASVPNAGAYTYTTEKNFPGGGLSKEFPFAAAGRDGLNLTLENAAVLANLSFWARPAPYSPKGINLPADPRITVDAYHANGTKSDPTPDIEWAFTGPGYGPWGLQDRFNDGATDRNLSFSEDGEMTKEVRFKMPKDAIVNGTDLAPSFVTGGWPEPFWGPEYIVSDPASSSNWEKSPAFRDFGGLLWVAWSSRDSKYTGGSDADILVRTYDGSRWSEPVDIIASADMFEDSDPSFTVFKDELYITWTSSQDSDFFSDDDILMKKYDGASWGPSLKVSSMVRAGSNDWAQGIEFKGLLYIFWSSTDSYIIGSGYRDLVSRTYDGATFGAIEDLSPDDGTIDWAYDVATTDERLYLIWEEDPQIGSYYPDIFSRTYDGSSWSGTETLSPSGDAIKDEIPGLFIWENPVTGKKEAHVIWNRGNGDQYGSGDVDVVHRMDAGSGWTPMEELSEKNRYQQNNGNVMIDFQGRLYAIWVRCNRAEVISQNDKMVVYQIWGDILIRSYDGHGWSDIKELTPTGTVDEAGEPTITVYGDRLYVAWSYHYKNDTSNWDIIMRNIDMREVHLSVDVGWDGTVEWTGTLRSSEQLIPLGAEAIQGALEDRPSILDDHGNDMAEIPVAITSSYPASISVRDLKVRYDHRVRFDATGPMMSTLSEAREDDPDGSTALGIGVEVGSSGRVILEDLNLTFYIDHKPFLIRPIPTQYMDEDIDAVRLVDLEEHFGDDWDDGRLTFGIVSSTDPAALEPRIEGRFLSLITVADNWNGAVNVTLKAIDGAGLWNSSNTFMVVVRPVNDPPVLNFIPDQEMEWGEDFDYVAAASDIDGDALTFSDDTGLFDIDPVKGLFSFKAKDKGEHVVNISVSDGFGGEDDQTVRLTVTPPPPDTPEVLTWDTECWSLIAIVALIAICLLIFFKYYRDHLAEPEVEKVSILKYGESQVTVEPPRDDEVPDDYTPTDTDAIWDEAERYSQRKAVKLDKARMDKQGPVNGNLRRKAKGDGKAKASTGTKPSTERRPPQ